MRRIHFWPLAATVVLLGTGILLRPQDPMPQQIASKPTLSYLVLFGIGDTQGTSWNGSVTVSDGSTPVLEGWRFAGGDVIFGNTWTLNTRPVTAPPYAAVGIEENGVMVSIPDTRGSVTVSVVTAQGNFEFNTQDVQFGGTRSFLGGRAIVAVVPSAVALTSSLEDEDFPAIAQSGDDIWVAYTRFVHGNRAGARPLYISQPITNFNFLARPTGGDQVLLMHYSKSQRVWTGPFAVTPSGQDIMRAAVAIDGQNRTWVFYSAQRSGNFDIYARYMSASGDISPEAQITNDAGTDLNPVAATDASGRVWVAWQGFRGGNLRILTAVQRGDWFSAEAVVSTSLASNWDPAIAAAPNGEVAISWDTYDKGDYDVYVRRVGAADQIAMDQPIPVAATRNFEARSSIAYDPQNRLWLAYEVSGQKWGKAFGAYDSTGIALYQNHSVQVRCLIGNDLYTTADDLSRALPGVPAGQLFLPSPPWRAPLDADPNLVQRRKPNGEIGFPAGPRNSFPRIATDSDGTVYLAFRYPAGTGLSASQANPEADAGSIWVEKMTWFDGTQWAVPGVFGDSDGIGDNRPAITALTSGRLLIAQAMDHRLSPLPGGTARIDGVNSDIYALELGVARTQVSPQLSRIGAVVPDAPDPAAVKESAVANMIRNYRATLGREQLQLLRGDFHRHTELSFDGWHDGPLVDAYRYGIDAAALDWFGCCDHENGGAREYSWWISQKYTDAYHLNGAFTPMFFYERSIAYPEGHRNIMFDRRGIRPLPRLPKAAIGSPLTPAPDTTMLYNYLHFFGGLAASHTGATEQGTDWRNNDPAVEPMVEIYQGYRQNYEMPGAPRANSASDSIAGYRPAGYVSAALALGYLLGFEASSDHVSTHTAFANLWVTEPTRAGIMDAVRKRRVYGSTDDILADVRSGDHFMGEAFATGTPPVFRVRLWGTNAFNSVVVVKDGYVVYSTSGGSTVDFTWQDVNAMKGVTSYYYVRGLQTDGQLVWVSPMWVTLQ